MKTVLITTLLGAALSAAAQTSYPITSRSGSTTVTGVYRPLDLNLDFDSIAVANSEFFYTPSASPGQTFALTSQLTGTFTSSYGASGLAGSWTLNLGFNSFNLANAIQTGPSTSAPILDSNVSDSNDGVDTITLGLTAADRPVGTLVYNGGLSPTVGALPVDGSDTPVVGDMFLLYAHNAGDVFHVTVDNITNPTNFYLALAQQLLHLGPYVNVGTNLYALDDGSLSGGSSVSRINEDCLQGTGRCGGVPVNGFFASSVAGATFVPEPGSLALVGLGLIAVAWARRSRQSRLDAG
ncbi:PEP-CTERM sorting domain-containing protein [Comamonadaceae bacterium G21597-S1]|nr:PEP-CTERM sorting domain-containing protein [Comamonadaceae bacterium G21597-S1]